MIYTHRPLLLSALDNLEQAYERHYHYSDDISDVVREIEVLRVLLESTAEGKEGLVSFVDLSEIGHHRSNELDKVVLCGREALKLSDGSDKSLYPYQFTGIL